MSVSVIIPTYNGAHKIMNVLRGLEQQQQMPDEVIVVIDGSTDDTAAMLRSQQFRFPAFRIAEQENGGRAKVRNRGAREATGSLLIFFDDDMRPFPQCVAAHIAHHRNHPGSIMTGVQKEELRASDPDIVQFKSFLSSKWSTSLEHSGDQPLPEDRPFITAANFSVPAAMFNDLGGFDERLTDAEDYDLAVRAVQKKVPLFYNPGALAWHDDYITCAGYIKRQRQYTAAQQRLVTLKPELYPDTHQYAAQPPTGLKAVFFKFFCHRFWISTVDKNRWTFLPKALRYRLYDWIITANGSLYPGKVKL